MVLYSFHSCGRPSGRSRIGTRNDHPIFEENLSLRSPFGAIEDWNTSDELEALKATQLRSPFGAIEDWNRTKTFPIFKGFDNVAVALRGDRGLEQVFIQLFEFILALRSPFGAIEDWNVSYSRSGIETYQVAVALRGDRGLEPSFVPIQSVSKRVAVALRGDRGLERRQHHPDMTDWSLRSPFGAIEDWNLLTQTLNTLPDGCGRPSGRSRIGTL